MIVTRLLAAILSMLSRFEFSLGSSPLRRHLLMLSPVLLFFLHIDFD